jgi:tetratricopeptide (TPR) repeat protein
LENIGIETAFITIPGHIFVLFNSEIPVSKAEDITTNPKLYVIKNGTVWIPVEVTLIGKSFLTAWETGAREYNQNIVNGNLEILTTKEAWNTYIPVTLENIDWRPELPSKSSIEQLYHKDRQELLNREFNQRRDFWNIELNKNPDSVKILNKLGILSAKYEKYDEAMIFFQKAIKIDPNSYVTYNNFGNLYLLLEQEQKALEAYSKSKAIKINNFNVVINLALFYKKQGKEKEAKAEWEKANQLDFSLAKQYETLFTAPKEKADLYGTIYQNLLWQE